MKEEGIKIQYASDLHLEFSQNTKFLEEIPLIVRGDMLVLAGDVSYIKDRRLNRHPFWDWASEHYEQVYVVPGNHEFYGGYDLATVLEGFVMEVRSNVRWINNRSVRIGKAELFFTTLWSPVPEEMLWDVEYGMMDCQRICYSGRPFAAVDYDKVHEKCLCFLNKALEKSTANKRVVVSHHVPTYYCNPPQFKDGVLTSAFVVELKDFIKKYPIDYWIYGHSHSNMPEVDIEGTKLLCNQLGYVKYDEHLNFQLDAFVEV